MSGDRQHWMDGTFDRRRRTMLKALGGGTAAVSLFAGTGAASEHADDADGDDDTDTEDGSATDGDGDGNWCPPCIDPLAGYTLLEGDEERPAEPDHVVDMYIEPRHVLFEETPADEADREPSIEPGETEGLPEDFPDFFFSPVGLHVQPGSVVEFYNESDDLHTITAIHPRFFGLPQRVPDGAQPFSSPPVMSEERWLYQFDEPGVYDMFCLPHFDLGMVVRFVVQAEGCPTPETEPLPEEGFPPAVQTVLSAPELDPEYILEQGSVAWDDLTIDERLDPATLFGEGP